MLVNSAGRKRTNTERFHLHGVPGMANQIHKHRKWEWGGQWLGEGTWKLKPLVGAEFQWGKLKKRFQDEWW